MWDKIVSFIVQLFKGCPKNQPANSTDSAEATPNTPQNRENPPPVAAAAKLAALYRTMIVNDELTHGVKNVTRIIRENEAHYIMASKFAQRRGLVVPWPVIAAIHMMESGGDFSRQILNGEKWTRKTSLVPKNRGPWRSWEMAAVAGLELKKDQTPQAWTIANTLDYLERWNGLGYRRYHPNVNTPYLWAGSNHYTKGKYTHDGKWSESAVSKQLGAALILQALDYQGEE